MLSNFRRYYFMASSAARIAGQIGLVWKFLRQYTLWTLKTYERIKIIAEKKGVTIPKPLVNMDIE